MRVLVSGGRDFTDDELFALEIFPYDNPTIIIGYDPDKDYPSGLDKIAYKYAKDSGWEVLNYPYHYHLGKAGGGSRNQQMLDEGKPDIVLAFPTPNSKGTWDMVRRAKKAGVKVLIFEGARS